MTPEQVALVLDGVERLRPHLDRTADAFYRNLFARHPEVRSMFPQDMSRLRVKFADELNAIVHAIPDFPAFFEAARALGARHVGYGVRAAHFAMVRPQLLAAIAEELGDAWTPAMAAAWTAAYDIISEAMLLGTLPAAR